MSLNFNLSEAKKRFQDIPKFLDMDLKNKMVAEKWDWMAEMAVLHEHVYNNYANLNENVAYVNQQTITGMGSVVAPQPGFTPGRTGSTGSGDMAQALLPVAMKIAYQTIGLDLVAVKPASSPRIELIYMDYPYDDSNLAGGNYEKPQVFRVPVYTKLKNHLDRVKREYAQSTSNLDDANAGRTFVCVVIGDNSYTTAPAASTSTEIHSPLQNGGLNGAASEYPTTVDPETIVGLNEITGSNAYVSGDVDRVKFYLEFVGYSSYTGDAIFMASRQTNTASSGAWRFDPKYNTFPAKMSIANALGAYKAGAAWASTDRIAYLRPSFIGSSSDAGTTYTSIYEGAGSASGYGPGVYKAEVELVSTLEDHIPGYTSAGRKNSPMTRGEEENFNPGVIGVKAFTKSIQVGTSEVSAAVKQNEIEDIKAATGYDIVQRLEGILINELSQKISRDIVAEVKRLSLVNRATAPKTNAVITNATHPGWDNYETIFDYDVDRYIGINTSTTFHQSNYRTGHESLQRKLITKIGNASTFILKEGRLGRPTYMVTSPNMASVLADNAGFIVTPYSSTMSNTSTSLYPAGELLGMPVYVDPYAEYSDNTIYLGRKNKIDEPGLVFIPYIMAQQLSIISEATRAPRIFLRSRYAVADIGFYPYKQFMAIKVKDTNGLLS